jgi:hypothetical protein
MVVDNNIFVRGKREGNVAMARAKIKDDDAAGGGGGGGNAMEQKIRSVKRWIRKDLAGGQDLFAFWKDIVAGRIDFGEKSAVVRSSYARRSTDEGKGKARQRRKGKGNR